MILFWLLALLLIALALAFVVPPLIGAGRLSGRSGDATPSLELYHSRLAALEEQRRTGALSEVDFAQARDELARGLLEETPERDERRAPPANGGSSGAWLAVAVGVGVPILAVVLYQRLGTPEALDVDAAPGGTRAAPASVQEMVAGLAERLESQPDDGGGWLLLARSYMALERYAQAFDAYGAARRVLGDSPALLADMAEAAALANRQNFLGVPAELVERALALDPEHPKALWLGAFAARQGGDAELAARRWRALLARQPEDSEAARVLRGLIAELDAAADTPPGSGGEGAGTGARAALTVSVALADTLAAELDGSETLYVFARAAQGPPMPLAVTRARAGDLPLTVTLNDSMAMAAGRRLSDAERVVVGARIAVSGTPTRSSGDLQGFSDPVPVADGAPVEVVIDERVP